MRNTFSRFVKLDNAGMRFRFVKLDNAGMRFRFVKLDNAGMRFNQMTSVFISQ
jgi:hypothetical protein